MKFRVTMKDPDVLDDAIKDAVDGPGDLAGRCSFFVDSEVYLYSPHHAAGVKRALVAFVAAEVARAEPQGQLPTKPASGSWLRDLEALVAIGAQSVDVATAKGAVEEARKATIAAVESLEADCRCGNVDVDNVKAAIRAAGKVSP